MESSFITREPKKTGSSRSESSKNIPKSDFVVKISLPNPSQVESTAPKLG